MGSIYTSNNDLSSKSCNNLSPKNQETYNPSNTLIVNDNDFSSSSKHRPRNQSTEIVNEMSYTNESTNKHFQAIDSTKDMDCTNVDMNCTIAEVRNSTSSKPTDASGTNSSSVIDILDHLFTNFELDLHTLFLFVKEVIFDGNTILVSPESNHRGVVVSSIIDSFAQIKNDDSLVNINGMTCALYSIENNDDGLPLYSLYNICDNNNNMLRYKVQGHTAHSVNFANLGMENINAV